MEASGSRTWLAALCALALATALAPLPALALDDGASLAAGTLEGYVVEELEDMPVAQSTEDGCVEDVCVEKAAVVESIQLEPIEPISVTEGLDGRTVDVLDADGNPTGETWFEYCLPGCSSRYSGSVFHEGDRLTLALSDGSVDAYTWRHGFYNALGFQLKGNYRCYSDQGPGNEWGVGEHAFTLEYGGASCEVPITVKANDVVSISYEYTGRTRLVEGADSTKTYRDYREAFDGGFQRFWFSLGDLYSYDEADYYQYYHVEWNRFEGNDILTVTSRAEGQEAVTKRYELHNGYYVNVDDENDAIDCDAVFIITNQSYENQWKAGNTYPVTVEYRGRTDTFDVEVVENPVKSIRYAPAKPVVCVIDPANSETRRFRKYYYGSWDYADIEWTYYNGCDFRFEAGDRLIVNEGMDSEKVYTYDGEGFVDGDGEPLGDGSHYISRWNNQSHDNEWSAGCENAAIVVKYMDVSCEIPVTVKQAGDDLSGGDLSADGKPGDSPQEQSTDISAAKATIAKATYCGSQQKPKVTLSFEGTALVEGEDYKVEAWANNVKAGTATVRIAGIGAFEGSVTKEFAIAKRALKTTKVALKTKVKYKKGEALKPKPTLSFTNPVTKKKVTLKLNRDYKLSYKHNKKRGTAKLVIIGKGNYTGKLTKHFHIV